ncbi:MAG: APC family permease [Legionellaceae bacterium]|nr:APC family permease [Legionellaceae bacterium]
MKKNLSAWGLLWISLTSMIGSGWLFGSLYSAHFAGPAAVLAWPIAGFLLLFVALSYAEIATMFSRSDTLARLPLYTHGRLTSVIMSGLAWISLAITPVIETQGLMQYASNYLPHLVVRHGVHYENTLLGYLFSLGILMSFVFFNYFGIRFFARINAGFTIWKILIPGVTVIALLSVSYHAENFSQYGGFMPYGWQGVMHAMSSGGVLFSLLGFRQVVIMMGEIDNPGKYVPLVLVGSLLLTTVLYTGLQWSFIGSMRALDLSHGWASLSFEGDAGPFAALAGFAGIIWLSVTLYIDAFVSPYATGLVYSTTAAHMLAGMADMGDVPQVLASKNNYQVPWVSLGANFLLAAGMLFVLRGWQEMAAFSVVVLMFSYSIGPICLVCLRRQLPSYTRSFRLRFGTIIAFIGFYICSAGIYWAGFRSVQQLLVLMFLGLGFYVFFCGFFKKSQEDFDGKHALWLLCYLFGLGVFSYAGNYGGKHWMPPYWDLLYLMGFSAIIFGLALFSRKSDEYTQGIVP